ncbi:pescadillo N-terminus domain-containing protein [Cryptosporidium andersoni]|uniref:Pescadillo homolog n=1 Tax=Cryptosporidium andersoni TaxID=117008 RepID=A0A1J4MUU8_9CRYT|nr:pescadillo N-terminus domain-containing protein [Cryptosporidium andersoni]
MGGRRVKKGVKGESAEYITRTQALKYLQLSLADFRRLCILKGIYPREPKKKLKGADKTYYHSKDILFLRCDPILSKFRDFKVYLKKYKKALSRSDRNKIRSLIQRKPELPLSHIVKQRYPCFIDALRDLDDALTTCALFASLGADDNHNILASTIEQSVKLMDEFMYLVSKCGFLKKSFISIKGFYFQVEILNEKIIWLLPHQFSQRLPDDVDFRVMTTFLEFYHVLLKFVNFKLYQLNNITYPPIIDSSILKSGGRFLSLKAHNLKNLTQCLPTDGLTIQNNSTNSKLLFEDLCFFISREVPLVPVAFVIISQGGKIGWENEASPIKRNNSNITHYIVDRPMKFIINEIEKYPNSEFIQPQWLFDCLNEFILLPTRLYAPGEILPPHLSPFVNDEEQGYIPLQREILDNFKGLKTKTKSTEDDSATTHCSDSSDLDDEQISEAREKEYLASLQAEMTKSNISEDINEDKHNDLVSIAKLEYKKRKMQEEIESRKSLLSRKHKRLLERIEYTKRLKLERAKKLHSRRKGSE